MNTEGVINIKKKISLLTSLRIFAALLLLTLVFDIYDWQADILWYKQLIPFTYLYAFDAPSTNNISVLLIPVLINIALWIPCYRSYLFLMVVIYIEYIKFILMIPFLLIALPFSTMFQRNNPFPTFLMVVFLIFVTKDVIEELKIERYKKLFKVDTIAKLDFDRAIIKMAIVFCLILIVPNAIEYCLLERAPVSYAVAEKMEFNTAFTVKLSKDKKLFLIRRYGKGNKTTNFLINDTDTMQNIKIMQVPTIPVNDTTFSGYTFTNDNKYIIVGDYLSSTKDVNFQVYNIETGKVDDRFNRAENISNIETPKHLKKIKNIEFNQDGRYFITVAQANEKIEIWDYIQSKMIYTDILPRSINSVIWLSDRSVLVSYNANGTGRNVEMVEYKLLENSSVLKTEKKKISQGTSKKSERIKRIKSSYDGKYLATCTADKDFHRITIWDIQKQEIISTIPRNSKATDVAFHPNGEKIVVLDILEGRPAQISIWDIKSGKKERAVSVSGISNYPYILLEVLDDGRRLMIINNAVNLVKLDY